MSTDKLNLGVIKTCAYGTHICSCGCGKIIGTLGIDVTYAYGVAEEEDIEGMGWRIFTPECWDRITAGRDLNNAEVLAEIYNEYSASEEA